MSNFWDSEVWSFFNLIAVLLFSLLGANALKKYIPLLKKSLIPTSVLGGGLLLLLAGIWKLATGVNFFETDYFGGKGIEVLETITYHALALGFIASTFKSSGGKMSKQRTTEIFNTGVTTVSTYLLQAVFGFGITLIAARIVKDFFSAAGVLLPFGYGQGTGQAMNYGNIYETEYGFEGGKSFGLTIAALGFLSASIGGVIHLNILRHKKKITLSNSDEEILSLDEVKGDNEMPMEGSMDKVTMQMALVVLAYWIAHLLMEGLSQLVPGFRSVLYGFNFLLGVLSATLIRMLLNLCYKKKVIRHRYVNNFLMTRISNFFFDVMVVAGIAAIRLSVLEKYWGIMLILGITGLVITYFYNLYIARKLFPDYSEEQFLMMYGMLTGTASTGIILLRELDGKFKTPAADNLVYQNFPAIVFGFPMMLLATMAPQKPLLTHGIIVLFFIGMNLILFRSQLFRKRKKPNQTK